MSRERFHNGAARAAEFARSQQVDRSIEEVKKSLQALGKANKKLLAEKEKLQTQIKDLKNQENKVESEKYSTVRMQLQMHYFMGLLDDVKGKGTLMEKGEFFSALLNRHPQRARKPFSAINELISSKNKATARLIKKDLIKVKEHFRLLDLQKEIKKVESAIADINKMHALEE